MHEQPEPREALPDHPVPAGLAAPADWQLRVDGLVAQPLVLSLREVDVLAAQTHAADFVWGVALLERRLNAWFSGLLASPVL
jgi:hypothetical protein